MMSTILRIVVQLQLVSHLGGGHLGIASCELEDPERAPRRSDASWPQRQDALHHSAIPPYEEDVDRELHPEGVYRVGRRDGKRDVGRQRRAAQESLSSTARV